MQKPRGDRNGHRGWKRWIVIDSCRGNNREAVSKVVIIFYLPPNETYFSENVVWHKWAGDDNGPFLFCNFSLKAISNNMFASCSWKYLSFRFSMRAVLDGTAYPQGEGKNKKEAKHKAAKNVLETLRKEPLDSVRSSFRYVSKIQNSTVCEKCYLFCFPCWQAAHTAESLPPAAHSKKIPQVNYVSWLNEYCNKHRLIWRVIESPVLGDSLQ